MSRNENLEYVDFDVVKEDWSLYRLEDDTCLKSKFILGGVLKEHGTEGEYAINSHTFTVAIVPKNLWGPPETQKFAKQELRDSVEKEDMKFTSLTPDMWNVYRLKDGYTISVKLELTMVSRTTKHNEKGERIYIFNIQPIIKGKKTKT